MYSSDRSRDKNPLYPDHLSERIAAYIKADSWNESQRIVEQYPELLTDEADELLNIVQPDVAVFGQKDAQQALLIRCLVDDLDFPVEVAVAPTVREPDGVAMSSRNAYLTDEQRRAAPALHRALERGAAMVRLGETDPGRVEAAMAETVSESTLLALEYVRCVDAADLSRPETIVRPVLLALAVHAGDTRLIANVLVSPVGE